LCQSVGDFFTKDASSRHDVREGGFSRSKGYVETKGLAEDIEFKTDNVIAG
jgi:hypothetical protein